MIRVRCRALSTVFLSSALLAGGFALQPASAQEPAAPVLAPPASASPGTEGGGDAATTPPTPEELERQLEQLQGRLQALERVPLEKAYLGTVPDIGSNTPTAYGSYGGEGGVGIGFQRVRLPRRVVNARRYDGSAGIVLGFGSRSKGTGFEAAFNVLELNPFGRRGSFDFQLHHAFRSGFAIAAGLENVLNYGGTDSPRTVYGVVSGQSRLRQSGARPFSRVYYSLGVGNGRFQSERDFQRGKNGVNVFGSVGTNLSRRASAFTEWTGSDLNVGMSFVPFRRLPLVITPALSDVTRRATDRPRFTVGVSYGFSY